MKHDTTILRLAIVTVALLTVMGAVAPGMALAQEDNPPQTPHRYFGQVTDGSGSGVADETVSVIYNGESIASTTTNADGNYGVDVTGNGLSSGDTVTISVGGESQEESWESGESTEVDFDINVDDDVVASGQGTVADDGSVTVPITGGSIDSVDLVLPADSGASTVDIDQANSPTGSAPDPGATVAIYLDISADVEVNGDTTVTVTVPESALDSAGVDNPALLHYVDGSWEELNTDPNTSGGQVTLTATASGLSPFAIAQAGSLDDGTEDGGTEDGGGDDDTSASSGGGGGGGGGGSLAADFLATNLDSSTTEVTQGDAITVSAELESDGITQDTQDVDLRIGGETIATQSVELSSGATTTVEFTDVTVDVDPGEYEYGIYTDDDSVTGTITVVADETADEEAAADEEADAEADAEPADEEGTAEEQADGATEDGIPGFGPLVAVLALVALALAARRKQ